MIANASDPTCRGKLNGLAQSIGSFSQLIGPVVGGYAFGWSIDHRDVPMIGGVVFVFDYMIVQALIAFFVSMVVPGSIVSRRN
jgi:hypothetical protein